MKTKIMGAAPFRLGLGILVLSSVIVLSCCCPTKPEKGSITGSVSLVNDSGDPGNDAVDLSGVTVALYTLADIDSTVAMINTEHPQIGVILNQETEFNHREENPIKVTTSNADGSYELKEIDAGIYNVAILKEDWGLRYIYEIEVSEGTVCTLDAIELYPVKTFNQYEGTDQVFRDGHTYVIEETTAFNCQVDIESGARIFINPGSGANFYGNVYSGGSIKSKLPWTVQSTKNMYLPVQTELIVDDFYGYLQFLGPFTNLKEGIVENFRYSLVLRSGDNEIDQMIFRNYRESVVLQSGKAVFKKVIFNARYQIGIDMNTAISDVTEVSGCIFHAVGTGITVNIIGTYNIHNSYFIGTSRGIVTYTGTGSIMHNEFDQNNGHIATSTAISPQIAYNNFSRSTGLFSLLTVGRAVINNNNFFSADQHFINLRIGGHEPNYTNVYEDLDAKQNYWAVSNLDDYLLDATDNAQYPGEPCAHYILYSPRRMSPVPNAGIQ